MNWKTIGIVVAIVIILNLGSYFLARRAFALPMVGGPSDGGPTS